MKFYLAKDFLTSFLYSRVDMETDTSSGTENSSPVYFRKLVVPVDVIPIDQQLLEVVKCAQLKERLQNKLSTKQNKLLSRGHLNDVFVSVGAKPWRYSAMQPGHFNLSSVPNGACALPKLIEGLYGVKLKVDFSVVENEQADAPILFTVSTQEMSGSGSTTFEDGNILFPTAHLANWTNFNKKIIARVTITVFIPAATFCELFGGSRLPVGFEKEVLSDVTILGADGTHFKANRCFLAANSSVFLDMFQDDIKEGKESTLEFPEMGAKSIRAFLKYLYNNDMWDVDDSQVVTDLLKLAHKYRVRDLEDKMKQLIPNKRGNVQNNSPGQKKHKTEKKAVTRKILEDPVVSDVTIVCGDGAEIKANRCFLAAQSSVFQIMFQTDMAESRTSILELPTMEKKSVQAFLKYLYYEDIKGPKVDFQVTFDLLQAGHMYDVKRLEGEMRKLILRNKLNAAFDVDGAAKLFMFARNLTPVDEDLKKVAVKALAEQCASLEESGVMQELARTDYKAVLELMKYAFQYFPSKSAFDVDFYL